MIIAIDGPAASGKSTTAMGVALKLGFIYLDTGAMYRVVTLSVLRSGINSSVTPTLEELLDTLELSFKTLNTETRIFLGKEDVSELIRSVDVTQNVSAVSAIPEVRKKMVSLQREIAGKHNSVVEGRDIGTVVFPDADYKFFLIADDTTRAKRRKKDLTELGISQSIHEIIEDLKSRDQKDSSRNHSPLQRAEGAIEVDTTTLSIDEQIDFIVNTIKTGLKEKEKKKN